MACEGNKILGFGQSFGFFCSMTCFRVIFFSKVLLSYFLFLGSTEVIAQSPKLDWGLILPAGSESRLSHFTSVAAEKGVKSVALYSAHFDKYKRNPAELKDHLKRYKIHEVVLNGGEMARVISESDLMHIDSMGMFLDQIGGDFLTFTSRKRDSYPPGKDELIQIGKNLDMIAQRLKKYGVKVVFGNQVNTICQTADELQVISDASSKKVLLMLDVANFVQAGSNPASFATLSKKRIKILVLQGLVTPKPGFAGPKLLNFQLVDLGSNLSKIDYKLFFSELKKANVKAIGLIKTVEFQDIESFQKSLASQIGYLEKEFRFSFK
jgi:sugar phosphate isomerase/epimerase